MKRLIPLCAGRPAQVTLIAALVLGSSEAAAQEPASAEAAKKPWYESIEFSAFVDAYFSVNLNFPKPVRGTNALRGNDPNNGFALAQAGGDFTYAPDPVGATISLRFGPQAIAYALYDAEQNVGLEYLRQAYATWKPIDMLAIDFGKWDTFMGGEYIESWSNYNYTRGVLHWLAQPAFHSGLRVTLTPYDELTLLAFGANGSNRTLDNNAGKTFGFQVAVTPVESFFASAGYIFGPEQDDTDAVTAAPLVVADRGANKRFKHVIDLLINWKPTEQLGFLLNADLGYEKVVVDPVTGGTDNMSWSGVMLGARYAFSDHFATALRGEFYRDPDGYTSGTGVDLSLVTGTLTIEASPDPHFIVKLDGRIDRAFASDDPADPTDDENNQIFLKGIDGGRSIQPTITLGIVAKTN